MTIEFYCAYCTAAVRVPDNAAGKVGECPKCGQKLLVPRVERPIESNEARVASQPDAMPSPPVPPEAPERPFPSPPAIDQIGPAPLPADSYAGKLRRRRRRRTSASVWIVPLLLGAVLLGALAFYFSDKLLPLRLEGELSAVRVNPRLPPGVIDLGSVGVSAEVNAELLTKLEAAPQRITTNLMRLEFRGAERELRVTVDEGVDSQLYRVDLRDDPRLMEFSRDQFEALDRPRLEELHPALRALLDEWERGARGPAEILQDYRYSVGVNALAEGLGYHLVAVYGRRSYPCVSFDSRGFAYFLLPDDAQRFEIRGRKLDDGTFLFSGRYDVVVTENDGSGEN